MKAIHVTASTEYDVLVGKDLLDIAADQIRSVVKGNVLCIVSDHTVWSLYGNDLKDSLTEAGFQCVGISFPSGEVTKSTANYVKLLEFLAENRIGRNDCIVALGGGVIGDLTGFAAATYLRGIDYIQIPTTVLAMVDSSVGGKTAIDLIAGKNLAGAFWQPKLVLCDTNVLNTLSCDFFQDGCAEIIKYGILYDPDLFMHLKEHGLDFDREWVISRCVQLKRDVVAIDEFDHSDRQKLNLGHTLGHAIEAASCYSISHGCAVAIGIAIICRATAKMELFSPHDAQDILSLLQQFGLPVDTALPQRTLYDATLNDKKRISDRINLIIPKSIGNCEIIPVSTESLMDWIRLGM